VSRAVPKLAADFVSKLEACKLVGYADTGGVATDGFGHTGPEVKVGRRISRAAALANLGHDLGVAAARIDSKLSEGVVLALSEHQYTALISFVFNLGLAGTTIWKLLSAKKFDAVPAEMMKFDHGRVDGRLVEIPGLNNRRQAEALLWKTADVATAVAVATAGAATPPSSTTREMDTPPRPDASAKPIAQSKTIWAGAATAAGGLLEVAKNAQGIVSEQAANSPFLGQVAGDVAIAIVGLGVSIMIIRTLDERAKRQ
jgi:lysozyme